MYNLYHVLGLSTRSVLLDSILHLFNIDLSKWSWWLGSGGKEEYGQEQEKKSGREEGRG